MVAVSEDLVIVDLFAGAGGLSTGVAQAFERLGLLPGRDVELHAINHWEPAIETHKQNHEWAYHYHAKIEELHPPNVVEPGEVTLLTGGPECTHFTTARGGKPISEQKRASAWHVLDWIEKLRPKYVLIENVKEFRSWSAVDDETGQSTRDGTIFERWVGMIEAFGYTVNYDDVDDEYGVVLNAADYGDPQSRERLFIMASRDGLPTAPEPTHSDEDPTKPDRRTAADIIDWSDLGTSLWTRDLEQPRVQPLSETTMGRIAEGIRRHCDDRLEPFADALERIDPDTLENLREQIVPAANAADVASILDEPFLVDCSGRQPAVSTPSVVKYYGTSTVTSLDSPLDTVTADGNHHALCSPRSYVLGQHSNSRPRVVSNRPVPTVAKGGKIQVCNPEVFCLRQQSGGVPVDIENEPLSTVSKAGGISMATVKARSLIKPRNGVNGDDHSNRLYAPTERPAHVVTARNHDGHLLTVEPTLIHYSHGGQVRDPGVPMPTVATERGGAFGLAAPYLVDYHGQSSVRSVDTPIGTIETRDRYALCVPELWPLGIDIKYRMLQPDELKQAQGFPSDYAICGDTKKDITAQIGNAVPVHLATKLVHHLLADETPSLSSFGGGISANANAEVPPYEDVTSDAD